MLKTEVVHHWDKDTGKLSYIVTDIATRCCAVIDPVASIDKATLSKKLNWIVKYIETHDLTLEWILETAFHPCQVLASRYLKSQLGGLIGAGENIRRSIKKLTYPNIKQLTYDEYFVDGELFLLGHQKIEAIFTPGIKPCAMSYYVDNGIFVGECLNMPEEGVAKNDFPDSHLTVHFESLKRLMTLPEQANVYVGHSQNSDYSEDKIPVCSILEQKKCNADVNLKAGLEHFLHAMKAHKEFKCWAEFQAQVKRLNYQLC